MRMIRPSDQAKLFVLGLLRSVSAFAATESKLAATANNNGNYLVASSSASASAAVAYHPAPVSSSSGISSTYYPENVITQPHADVQAAQSSLSSLSTSLPITLRLARRSDVAALQRCNLATLPENYHPQFYATHMKQWPELALVATVAPTKPSYFAPPSSMDSSDNSHDQVVVAYVLGKVEDRRVLLAPDNEHVMLQADQNDVVRRHHGSHYQYQAQYFTERLGHVTSLAVLEPFRRQGLAQALMEQLHAHLQDCYQVHAVGLHVRKSNVAAGDLYGRFGYDVDEAIGGYYQDGEDAYFMKKKFPHVASSSSSSMGQMQQRFMFGLRPGGNKPPRPWKMHDHLRLPRLVGKVAAAAAAAEERERLEEEQGSELLTGTM